MKWRCILLIICLLYLPAKMTAQHGFFEVYPMDFISLGFLSAQTIDDKLFVYSQVLDTTVNLWGMNVTKFDTSGNSINGLTFTDTLGTSNIATNGMLSGGLFTLNNSGELAGTGSFFNRKNLFVLKVDTTLTWYQIYEHADTTVTFDNPYHISAFDDGFVVSGIRSKVNNDHTQKFIQKLDHDLNEGWNLHFEQVDVRSNFITVIEGSDNKIFAAGYRSEVNNLNESSNRQSIIYTFDSSGNVLHIWATEPDIELGIFAFNLSSNNGYIYSTHNVVNHPNNIFSLYPRLVRRDSTYQKLWEVELPVTGSGHNRVMSIKQSQDGHWLVSAKLYTELAGSPGNPRLAPCIFKISDAGEILWSTCVTFPFEWVNNQYPSFRVGNVIQISSGSMYVVGSVNRSNPSRTLGWMLKLDADGCLYENPCHPEQDTVVGLVGPEVLAEKGTFPLTIHPNPAVSIAIVQIPSPGSLSVYDLQGRLLYQNKTVHAGNYTLATGSFPAGMYIVLLQSEYGALYRTRLGVLR